MLIGVQGRAGTPVFAQGLVRGNIAAALPQVPEIHSMQQRKGALLAALLGLVFCLGAETPVAGGKKVFLVYSTDERSELAPCG